MPIRWRLTLLNALVVGAILVALGLALFFVLRHSLLSDLQQSTRQAAVTTARTLQNSGDLDREDTVRLALQGTFVVVRDADGGVLFATTGIQATDGGDGVWRRALSSGDAASGTAEVSDEAPDYVYAVPVKVPGSPAAVVEAGRSYETAHETLESFAAILAAVLGAALFISIAGAYLMARAALRPVDEVVAAANRMDGEKLSRRLPVSNPRDEIGRLTITVNDLLCRVQGALERREEALERQRRFAADASHELRTPLTSIDGYARMLEEWALNDPEASRESIAAIRKEAGRLRALSEQLLEITRADEGAPLNPAEHDLAEVAREAVERATPSAGGVRISYRSDDGDTRARFDRALVERAAGILLDNAIKYTAKGGRVTVRAYRKDGCAALEISDTGMGIPEEHLPHIFERFYRADPARSGEGAGLGLSIARQVSEAHQGRIQVRSKPGEGSIFTLLIPAARSE